MILKHFMSICYILFEHTCMNYNWQIHLPSFLQDVQWQESTKTETTTLYLRDDDSDTI